jgi:hypothetical protein
MRNELLEKLSIIAMEGQEKAAALANLTEEEKLKIDLTESMHAVLVNKGFSSEEIEQKIQILLEGI